jgi:arsenite methyltransferase
MTAYLKYQFDMGDPAIASVVDELSFWASRFGALLFEHLEIRRDARILDLGCGTGFPSFELAGVHGASCRVTGADIWREALVRARAKLKTHHFPNVDFVEADGANMPFPDAEFDLIVSNLVVNNLAEPRRALAECFRVAKPGARIVLTTNLEGHMREFYDVFRETLAETGGANWMERLEANENHRGTSASVCELVREAGFDVARTIEGAFRLRYLDGSALLNHPLTKIGFLGGWKRVADPDDEYRVFERVEQRLNALAEANGGLVMTVPTLYVEGRK